METAPLFVFGRVKVGGFGLLGERFFALQKLFGVA